MRQVPFEDPTPNCSRKRFISLATTVADIEWRSALLMHHVLIVVMSFAYD